MTRLLVVLLLLLPLALAKTAYAEEDMKSCSLYDDRIEEVRGHIAEEEAKDSIDFYYLNARRDLLTHLLEAKVSCLDLAVETYRQVANEIFEAKCGSN